MSKETSHFYEFGPFRVDPARQLLLRDGQPVPLTSKAFETLLVLVRHSEEMVSKDELMKQLWPDTFVEESNLTQHISMLRKALGESPQDRRYIVTMPGRGYRFAQKVREASDSGELVVQSHSVERVTVEETEARQESGAVASVSSVRQRPWNWIVGGAVTVALLAVAAAYVVRMRRPPPLNEADLVLVSDFVNTTGEPVFDGTLKQGLAVQLEQSPFIDLVSDRKVSQTLKQMGRPADDRLTPEVTREVCLRAGGKAMLTGSIVALGNQFVIGLKATNCNTGDVLAEAQERAADKEAVLKALDSAAVSVRGKLGESLSSVQKYATPLEEATTPSLEALQAYSLARKTAYTKAIGASLPFYKRAVELDPNFAMAYRGLSTIYMNLNQAGRSAENARKAYALREKVSERERFSIEAEYYTHATGELEKVIEVYELWLQIYPREFVARGNLGVISGVLGNWEKALAENRESMRLDSNIYIAYGNLAYAYTNLNRLDEAEAVYKQAEERKVESEDLLLPRYQWAFVKGDTALMARILSAAMGKPGTEELLLASQAQTEGWYGHLKSASELTRRAMDSAWRNDAKEAAAVYQTTAALNEVEAGNREQARADANAAVKLAPNRDVQAMAALALARAGDEATEKLAAGLDNTFPLDTLVQRYWLPTIRAAVALQRKDPGRALELLKVANNIELSGYSGLGVFLCPVYMRGEAYLMLHDGNAAAVEFQKFIDHRGLVSNSPWGALARLGLARALAQVGETQKSLAAYREFLTLWKDADPDLRTLKEAKAEYKKLSEHAPSAP